MLEDGHVRRPQRDIVFTNKADAARYTGHNGQTTYTFDRAADCYEHRAHDGETIGGLLMAAGAVTNNTAITAKVVNVGGSIPSADDPNGPLVINHGLGYFPLVQVLDLSQSPAELIEVEVAYPDINTIELTAGATGASNVTIMMR